MQASPQLILGGGEGGGGGGDPETRQEKVVQSCDDMDQDEGRRATSTGDTTAGSLKIIKMNRNQRKLDKDLL